MTGTWTRSALLLLALAATGCAERKPGEPPPAGTRPAGEPSPAAEAKPSGAALPAGDRLELRDVGVACRPAAGGGAACDVTAEVHGGLGGRALAVLTVREGERLVQRPMVAVDGGKGVLRLQGLRSESAAPSLAVTLLGEVLRPTQATLALSGLTTTCGAEREPGLCVTRGRVECSSREGWLAVVEVRPPGVPALPAYARLKDGAGELLLEWRAAGPVGEAPRVDAEVLGIVGARAGK